MCSYHLTKTPFITFTIFMKEWYIHIIFTPKHKTSRIKISQMTDDLTSPQICLLD